MKRIKAILASIGIIVATVLIFILGSVVIAIGSMVAVGLGILFIGYVIYCAAMAKPEDESNGNP